MILWFSRNKVLTVLLIAGYSLLVIFGHGAVSAIADWVTNTVTRSVFNGTTTALLLGVLTLLTIGLVRNLSAIRQSPFGLLFALATPLLAIAAYNTLFVTNVECIHFLQYALLAIPLFALTGHYGGTVLATTLIGAIDETWQYLWIYRDVPTVYFDFNDIILNLLGAGLGVTALYLLGAIRGAAAPVAEEPALRTHRFVLLLPAVVGVVLALTLLAGLVRIYPDAVADGRIPALSHAPAPVEFWKRFPWGKTYHLLHPFEGLFLAQGLLLFYGLLDRKPPATTGSAFHKNHDRSR